MDNYIKTALITFIAIIITIQFVPAGEKNISTTISNQSLEKTMVVPNAVLSHLKSGCYDCHSNNTVYPWYSYVQPAAWWLNSHIEEGKEHLNFDEIGNLDTESRFEMMEEIKEEIESHEMPMASYTLLHPKAKFSNSTTDTISRWLASQMKVYQSNEKTGNVETHEYK